MSPARRDIDGWAAATERTCAECEQAHLLLLDTPEHREALEHVMRARQTAWTTYRSMLDAGAAPVESYGVPSPVPLHLLDTPATRRLLAALEAATEAANDVDRERGWLHEGEPAGWGETLAGMAYTLRVEVEGPAGGGRE